ncbi:uncharacterized protein [Penaeus vannamei]|uniref:uncharacterized protein isoform X1 n=1 Tax=Penaeus vannamei TaxID=6689 RepID=UPI00387F669F
MSCSDGGTGPDVSGSDPDVDIRSAEAQKKRRGNPKLWGRNVAKAKRDSGQEYVSDKTKNVVAARVVGPPCTCPRRCYDRVGADNVKCVFQEYWKMGDHNAQSSYLMNRVVSKEVSRRYAGPSTKRNVTYEYSVLVDNNKVLVCKVAFCNIHSISMKRVDNVTKKAGKTGVAPVDQRGSASSANKTPDDVLQKETPTTYKKRKVFRMSEEESVFVVEGIGTDIQEGICKKEVSSQVEDDGMDSLGENLSIKQEIMDSERGEDSLPENKDWNLSETVEVKEEITIKEEQVEVFDFPGCV